MGLLVLISWGLDKESLIRQRSIILLNKHRRKMGRISIKNLIRLIAGAIRAIIKVLGLSNVKR